MPDVCKIALVGRMKSGKSTARDFLVNSGFRHDAFAAPVKQASVIALNAVLEYLGRPAGMNLSLFERDKSQLRPIAQFIGTEFGRNYLGPDTIWIDKLLDRVQEHESNCLKLGEGIRIVVDDCRFVNEADELRVQGFTIVKLIRPLEERFNSTSIDLHGVKGHNIDEWEQDKIRELMSHESESQVDMIQADYTVPNEGQVSELHARLATIANQIMGGLYVKNPSDLDTISSFFGGKD